MALGEKLFFVGSRKWYQELLEGYSKNFIDTMEVPVSGSTLTDIKARKMTVVKNNRWEFLYLLSQITPQSMSDKIVYLLNSFGTEGTLEYRNRLKRDFFTEFILWAKKVYDVDMPKRVLTERLYAETIECRF